mgnify:CR=1 FL=1
MSPPNERLADGSLSIWASSIDSSLVDVEDVRLRPSAVAKKITRLHTLPCLGFGPRQLWLDSARHDFWWGGYGADPSCGLCGMKNSEVSSYVDEELPPSTMNVRGPLTNHEFVALYLFRVGPSHAVDVSAALGRFRGKDGSYNSPYFTPDGRGMGSCDGSGHNWCGSSFSDDVYWWCPRAIEREPGKRKRKWGKLMLTRRGVETAARALAKAWILLDLEGDVPVVDASGVV